VAAFARGVALPSKSPARSSKRGRSDSRDSWPSEVAWMVVTVHSELRLDALESTPGKGECVHAMPSGLRKLDSPRKVGTNVFSGFLGRVLILLLQKWALCELP
jgi:hypothetical protein